jgi:hypothetical protein
MESENIARLETESVKCVPRKEYDPAGARYAMGGCGLPERRKIGSAPGIVFVNAVSIYPDVCPAESVIMNEEADGVYIRSAFVTPAAIAGRAGFHFERLGGVLNELTGGERKKRDVPYQLSASLAGL